MAGNRRLRPASIIVPILAAASLALSAVPAAAQDSKEGHRLARQWCAGCHDVAGSTSSDMAPGFRQIANDPARTPDGLRAWLSSPHPVMPDFGLSRLEIESIIAYLESLADR